jgi:hypothetical protein
LPQSKLFLSIC